MNNLEKYSFPTPNTGLLLSSQLTANGNMAGYTAQLLFLVNNFETRKTYAIGLDTMNRNGAISRSPFLDNNTSVDDYLAVGCLNLYARDILHRGRINLGFLDINPLPNVSWSQWLYRFQGMWSHLKISDNQFIGPIGRLIWAYSIYKTSNEAFSNQDSWIESHLMVLVKERSSIKSWIMDWAIKQWRTKKGSKKTSEIMAEYTGIPDHPLVQAWEPYN